MRKALLGLYTYAEFGLFTMIFLPTMGIAWALHRGDPVQRVPGRWMRRYGRVTSDFTPLWKFSIEGTPPADIHEKPYVVISNHESTADPFLLAHLPWDMRWIGKDEINKLPVLGWIMKFGGDMSVKRGDGESVRRMLKEALATLQRGMPIMIFPEGTRSPDGNLLPFKDGAFHLAIAAQCPVLPVAISGTKDCRPKGSKWFGEARAAARVLAPIPTKGMTEADLPRLKELARAAIAAALPDLRARTGLVAGKVPVTPRVVTPVVAAAPPPAE